MQYFVSIENTAYYQWQIELLIESFKKHNLQDKLIISIAENDEPPFIKINNKNLLNHKNKYVHSSNLIKSTNKLIGLIHCLQSNIINESFAIIEPDMVLMKPLSDEMEENVIFDQDDYLELEIDPELFLPLGDVIVFNKQVDLNLFVKIINKIKELGSEKESWIIELKKHLFLNEINVKSKHLTQTLLNHDLITNFISYKHGIPPEFSKLYYKYEKPIGFVPNGLDPLTAIYMNNVTTATNYVCDIITSYWAYNPLVFHKQNDSNPI